MAELVCKLYVAWEDHSDMIKSKECVHFDYINNYCLVNEETCKFEGRGRTYQVAQEDDGEPE